MHVQKFLVGIGPGRCTFTLSGEITVDESCDVEGCKVDSFTKGNKIQGECLVCKRFVHLNFCEPTLKHSKGKVKIPKDYICFQCSWAS